MARPEPAVARQLPDPGRPLVEVGSQAPAYERTLLTTQVLTGVLLLVLPVAYNGLYTLLARGFDYPDILRQPTGQVLERFTAGGSRLVLLWWGFAMSAVLLAPAVVLVSATLAAADPAVLAPATAVRTLAA